MKEIKPITLVYNNKKFNKLLKKIRLEILKSFGLKEGIYNETKKD